MEVADQWRREWAGTAEYGKVTEGGVTRRIARAMEVLHASGPGAKVRVLRAAYHSTAAPGAPAASFMLHSSRRVISSGFNFLESSSATQPIKPLEISSTPLESSPDSIIETENYKVTEPDDFDISEPSKWRGSTKSSSIRMPSEESSSTDNASIIELDSRNTKNLYRKYSYDSESSDVPHRSRSNSRTSPILDTPVTLSTLKYKSLLNSSNDWNTRRKSYSFEDTSPLNETILHSNETLAMESSTDSGICKSTELVNEHFDDNQQLKYSHKDQKKSNSKEESFKDWLNKNRPVSHYRGTKFKTYRDHDTLIEEPLQNNISLQSSGKVSITLPVTIEGDDDTRLKSHQVNEECDRKIKRVEFCKTEVHFTAESGKVNIIATDEKPPPSNDFRKRRSAFVPIHSAFEKPITLFGDKNEFDTINNPLAAFSNASEIIESDENTAATKSILKNKIPKPKPYLLGENMAFGSDDDGYNNKNVYDIKSELTAVSLVNKQLETDNYDGHKPIFVNDRNKSVTRHLEYGAISTGPNNNSSKLSNPVITNIKITRDGEEKYDSVKNKFSALHVPQNEKKPKTRPLRESDLTYFGVDPNNSKLLNNKKVVNRGQHQLPQRENIVNNVFNSVKLIQHVANSVCSSEHESDDTPEYQNLPINSDYQPVPFPRLRSKFDAEPTTKTTNAINKFKIIKSNMENVSDEISNEMIHNTRRSKVKSREETQKNRSISEPPKVYRRSIKDNSIRSIKHKSTQESLKNDNTYLPTAKDDITSDGETPVYANLNTVMKITSKDERLKRKSPSSTQRKTNANTLDIEQVSQKNTKISTQRRERRIDSDTESSLRKKQLIKKDSLTKGTDNIKKIRCDRDDHTKKSGEQSVFKTASNNNQYPKLTQDKTSSDRTKERRSRSLQRPSSKSGKLEEHSRERNYNVKDKPTGLEKDSVDKRDLSHGRIRDKSKENSSLRDNSLLRQNTVSISNHSPIISNEKDPRNKSKSHRANKRSEYVINYDDKNGTVSSICKIKPGLATPKRNKHTKEIKESHKDINPKTKAVNNIAPRK